MHWSKLVPELTVSDFGKSLPFYTEALGFQIVHQRNDPRFAYLDQETAQLMLAEYHEDGWHTAELEPPYGRGINFQIELTDIHPVYNKLKSMDYPLFRDIAEHWYDIGSALSGQREFLVQDPDGYLLRFCQYLGEREKAEAGDR